jgi:hypothetical protein
MQAHVPTSVILQELVKKAPAEHVTLAWLMDRLRARSFGIVMLLLALVSLVPGASAFIGILLAVPAYQMIVARRHPALPRFIAERAIPTRRIARLIDRAVPLLRFMERFIRPRWGTPFETTKRVVGVILLLLGVTLVAPIPFSNIIPALAIALVAFAYLEEDGLLLLIALVASLVSLSITAGAVWGAVRATDWLTNQ